MARNYSIAEAAEIITHGEDLEAIADIGRRYPLLAQKLAVVGTKAGEEFVDIMSFMPEHVSANKVNTSIKRQLENAEDAEDDDESEDEAPKKAKKEDKVKTGKAGRPKKKVEEPEDDDEEESDYDNMTNKEMYNLLGEMGKRKDCKEKFGDLSHDSMLKYLKKYGAAAADAEDEDEDEDKDNFKDLEELINNELAPNITSSATFTSPMILLFAYIVTSLPISGYLPLFQYF